MSSVDDETIMDVLTESDAPRLTTTDVAEQLPLARGTVRSRLQALADEGRLDREREGRDVVWFLPDRADEPAPDPELVDDDGDEADATGAADETDDPDDGDAGKGQESAASEGDGAAESDDAEPTAITERGETVAGDAGTAAEVAGRPIDRVDEDLLARAAIAAVLLAVIYAIFRRIRGGP